MVFGPDGDSESDSLRRRTLAVRMRRLASFLSPAVILLVRAPDAVWEPVLFIGLRLLCHVADRVLHFRLCAVFGFVPRLATVVAVAFKLSTSSSFLPVAILQVIDPTGWPIDTIHRRDERRVGRD